MTYEPREPDPEKARELQAKVRAYYGAYRLAKEAWEAAEQALLEEQCADLPRYRVNDVILVPRVYFGREKLVRAKVVSVVLHYSEGDYLSGEHWRSRWVSYSVYLEQKDGSFGGSSVGFEHREVSGPAPEDPS
jgi:hypothetical protein